MTKSVDNETCCGPEPAESVQSRVTAICSAAFPAGALIALSEVLSYMSHEVLERALPIRLLAWLEQSHAQRAGALAPVVPPSTLQFEAPGPLNQRPRGRSGPSSPRPFPETTPLH